MISIDVLVEINRRLNRLLWVFLVLFGSLGLIQISQDRHIRRISSDLAEIRAEVRK